jgi:pimeloyl-ACP methyl ester carboxylesterase
MDETEIEMVIRAVEAGPEVEHYRPVVMRTDRGDIHCRYSKLPGARLGAVWVGGVGGGFDSPAHDLYGKLTRDLMPAGIASLRVQFRNPMNLTESVLDVMAGLRLLEGDGMRSIALIGHSFGGAVVIQAASAFPIVRTVVTLASQSYAADLVATLGPRCSILLMHGANDTILPPACSQHLYDEALEPKRLKIMKGAGHVLDEVADEVKQTVRDWVVGRLKERDIEDWRWGVGTEGPSITE